MSTDQTQSAFAGLSEDHRRKRSTEFESAASGTASRVDGTVPIAVPDLLETTRRPEQYSGTKLLGYPQESRRIA